MKSVSVYQKVDDTTDIESSSAFLTVFIPCFLFFISGFCSLVYEVVWSRMLVLIMGNTTLAASAILTTFMAGLSLGSYYWGKHVETINRPPLFIFGCLETGIGVSAIVISQILWVIIPSEIWFSHVSGSNIIFQNIVRYFFCFCALFCPTFLIGGTLAVMGRHIIPDGRDFGRKTATLYGINAAGALLGAFVAGFFLIQLFGHNGSLILAAAMNLLIGLTSMGLSFLGKKRGKPEESVPAARGISHVVSKPSKATVNLVLIGVWISGSCGIAYQILWTRLLILIIDNSVYSFTIIVMAFLAGITIGSLLITPFFRLLKNPALLFAFVEIGIGITAFIFPFYIHLKPKDPNTTYLSFLFLTMPMGILLPTTLMGMAFPLAAKIYWSDKQLVGESLGTVYAANTAGSVLGGITAGFLFIGYLGFQKSMTILPCLNLAIGALIAFSQLKPKLRYAFAGLMFLVVIIALQIMPYNYFHEKYAELEPKSELIYYKETMATTAAVFERPDKNRALYLNGIPEVDTSQLSIKTFKLMGALPGLIHKNPKNALMITFGAGVAAGTTALFVNSMDCVDLAQQAREIAVYFESFNDRITENNKIVLHHDDARHFLQCRQKQYSIIISDATHPRVYDSWVLFTNEFYELVQKKLTADGIFLQWLPFHGLSLEQYTGIVNTFTKVFKHTSIWCVDNNYSLLLSTPETLTIDFQKLQNKILQTDIKVNLRQVGLDNPFKVLSYFFMGEKNILGMLSNHHTIMTDNNPAHLFFPFQATFKDQYSEWPKVNYQHLKAHEESVIPFVENMGDSKSKSNKIMNIIRYYETNKIR